MELIDASFSPIPPPAHLRLGVVNVTADFSVVAAVRGRLAGADITSVPIDSPSLDEAFAAAAGGSNQSWTSADGLKFVD